MKKILITCTTDSMIWNFLIPHIKELEKKGYIVECASSKTGLYFDELRNKYGIKILEIPFTRSPLSIKNLVSFIKLNKLVKKKQYDIIFCHEPVGGLMGRLVGKLNKKKVIYMAHGFHFFKGASLKHWLIYYPVEYILSYITDVLITINQEDYGRLKNMHAKQNYYIHGIGIQEKIDKSIVSSERLKAELGLKKSDIILLTVGEISVRKNQKVILEALKILKNSKLKLIICGNGPLKSCLEKKVVEYGLQDNVIFVGFVKNVGDYLDISDFFIFPSLWEGLSIAGLEAMKKGVFIIGANRRGIKDYVIHMKTGLTFEPDNPEELADKITFIFKNKNIKDELLKKAAQEINKYEINNIKQELEIIYKKEF